MTGRPGAGKATLAKRIGPELWMPVVSRDEIKEGYVNTFGVRHDELPAETNLSATNFFFEITQAYLTRKISVVIEAAFQHDVWAHHLPKITALGDACFIICTIPADLATERYLQRGLRDARREFYHGDKRVVDFREHGIVTPPAEYVAPKLDVPTLEVSTVGEYVPGVGEIVEWCRVATA